MNEVDWLQELKPGDTVIVSGRGIYGDGLARVEKVTDTQIVIGNERYNRANGRVRGADAWNHSWLSYPEPERVAAIRHQQAARYLCGVKWQELPPELVSQVRELVKQARTVQPVNPAPGEAGGEGRTQ